MEVVSIEKNTYCEMMARFNVFVTQMKEMCQRNEPKKLGDWLDSDEVCEMLTISPRTLQSLRYKGILGYSQIQHRTYYKLDEVVELIKSNTIERDIDYVRRKANERVAKQKLSDSYDLFS